MTKVLYVGPIFPGSVSKSFHDAFARANCEVHPVNTHAILSRSRSRLKAMLLGGGLPTTHINTLNAMITDAAAAFSPDLTFYFNIPYVSPATLVATGRIGVNFAFFSDDMFNSSNQTPTF